MNRRRTLILGTLLLTLGILLILASPLAPNVHSKEEPIAEQIPIDTGTVGEPAKDLVFGVESTAVQVDLVFTDNKTLTWGQIPKDRIQSLEVDWVEWLIPWNSHFG